jgi:hypothetical protein
MGKGALLKLAADTLHALTEKGSRFDEEMMRRDTEKVELEVS